MLDGRGLREAAGAEDGAGVMDKMNETISSHYKLLKHKLKLPEEAGEEGGAGCEGGAMVPVKEQMRRALHFMTLGRKAGSDGGGSEGRYEHSHSSQANSQRGGGGSLGGGGSERRQGGGHGGFASAPPSSLASRKPARAPGEAGLDAAALHKLKKRQVRMGQGRLRQPPRGQALAPVMLPRASTRPLCMPAQELCGEDVLTWVRGGRPRSWCRCGDTRT